MQAPATEQGGVVGTSQHLAHAAAPMSLLGPLLHSTAGTTVRITTETNQHIDSPTEDYQMLGWRCGSRLMHVVGARPPQSCAASTKLCVQKDQLGKHQTQHAATASCDSSKFKHRMAAIPPYIGISRTYVQMYAECMPAHVKL